MSAEGCGSAEQAGGGLSGRRVNTTTPLTGGGPLSSDLILGIPAATDSIDGYFTAVDHVKLTGAVPGTRTLGTTAPLAGGGDLSANRTLSIPAATDAVDGYLTAVDHAKITAAVPNTRRVNTTAPLTGGGPLSADLTLAMPAATAGNDGYMTAAYASKVDGLPASAVPTARTISTTVPLTGGGDLTANRTLALSIGTGLSLDGTNNLQNNLLVGLSGGQTLKGGTGASESLTLNSTANATKGAIFLNDGSPTQVGFGISAMSAWSGAAGALIEGPTQSILMGNSTDVYFLSNAYFASPNWTRKTSSLAARLQMFHGTFELDVAATGAAGSTITWLPALQIDALQNTQLGKATLATTATDGFPYLPVVAGAPSGVPTAKAGFAPFQYDTTNNKLWIYNGAWKGVVLA